MANKDNDSSKLVDSIDESENKSIKEDQSENDLETNTNNNIQLIEENNSEDPYIKYITQIEQLQNELLLEKSITNSLKNFGSAGDELIKLKTDLQDKEQKLLQLKQTNKKQEEALNSLRKKIAKDIPKNIKSYSQNKFKQNKNNNDIIQNEAVNIVLKIKDRELNDAIQKMNSLKKENQNLKDELYKNDDYSKKVEILDTSKENEKKIKELNIELKTLNKQLIDHKICIEEQIAIYKEYNELKNKLKELKNNTNANKNKIKEIESKSYINTEPNEKNEKNLFSNKLFNKKKKNNLSLTDNKINNISITNTRNNNNNNIILPPIATPRKYSQNKNNANNNINMEQSILTNDFIERVKKYFENNKEEFEFETLLFKINEIENSRKTIENKHKSEINQFNKQINTLDEQYQLLNNNGKNNSSNIKVLKSKLNIVKGETKAQSKKYVELKKEFDSLDNISKEKDYEISLLLGQINSLRNLANFSDTVLPEDKINTYVNKLKIEQKDKNIQTEKELNKNPEEKVINSYDNKI